MLLEWKTTDRIFYTAEYRPQPDRWCNLVVESLGEHGWDWTIWCGSDATGSLHGTAPTLTTAKRAAELALPELRCHCWEPAGARAWAE